MFRNWKFRAAALALGALLAFPVSGLAAADGSSQVKTLSFMGGYLETHPVTQEVFKPFMDAAEKKSGGKLSFRYFTTNSLYAENEAFSAISDGRADVGQIRPVFFPKQMRLLSVVSLPGMCPNALVGSLVMEELIEKFPEVRAELPAGTVHLTSWASASYQLHSTMPIRSRDDLKGKKIAVWDNFTLKMVEALGAHGIRMSSTDTFIALSRGMVDGVLCPLAPIRSYKLSEDAKYHLLLGLGVNTFTEEFNKKSWDALSGDMKKWISSEGGMKMAEACGRALETSAFADVEWMKSQGHEFITLTDAERSEFLAPLDVFIKGWKTEFCKGLDAGLVDRVYKFARERSRYHMEQMRAGKYGDYTI